jgi:hypothetical protein
MDETYIKIKGVGKYLYRAVDKKGKTVDFRLSAKRDSATAMRFFKKTCATTTFPKRSAWIRAAPTKRPSSRASKTRTLRSWFDRSSTSTISSSKTIVRSNASGNHRPKMAWLVWHPCTGCAPANATWKAAPRCLWPTRFMHWQHKSARHRGHPLAGDQTRPFHNTKGCWQRLRARRMTAATKPPAPRYERPQRTGCGIRSSRIWSTRALR